MSIVKKVKIFCKKQIPTVFTKLIFITHIIKHFRVFHCSILYATILKIDQN